MVRLLIVDDHIIVRHGLKQLAEGAPDQVMTADVCPGEEALKLLHGSPPDVVLLGTNLSGLDHIELLKQIKAERPNLPVLVLSISDEARYCGRILRAGASGILTKESTPGELVDAVAKVSRGRKYISPPLAERMTSISTDESIPLLDALSDREYEVMVAIASGKRIKQIADEMSLSIKTVSTYHSRILQKLNISNDAQLIRYAIGQGIIRDSVMAREKLILTELNIRTAPMITAVREIWRQRKAVIIVVGILAILAYIFTTYAVKFLF